MLFSEPTVPGSAMRSSSSIALSCRGWAQDVAVDIKDGAILAVEARADGRGRSAHRRHRAAGAGERAQPHVPARDGRPRRGPRSAERYLLDLAAGHVPVPGPDARRRGIHRGLRDGGDARGRVHALGEFHYLHHDIGGRTFGEPASWPSGSPRRRRPASGSRSCRSSFTNGGFGGAPRRGTAALRQRRRGLSSSRRGRPKGRFGARRRCGRHRPAQPPRGGLDTLGAVLEAATEGPVHIHAAEQVKEVEDCVAWSGRRPVAWLSTTHRRKPLVPRPRDASRFRRDQEARRLRRRRRPVSDHRGQSRRRHLLGRRIPGGGRTCPESAPIRTSRSPRPRS